MTFTVSIDGIKTAISIPASKDSLVPGRLETLLIQGLPDAVKQALSIRLESRVAMALEMSAVQLQALSISISRDTGLASDVKATVDQQSVVIEKQTGANTSRQARDSLIRVLLPNGLLNKDSFARTVLDLNHREFADTRGVQWYRISTLGKGTPGDFVRVSPD